MRFKLFVFALLCCTVLASCRTEDPLPAPPAGTLLFGEKQDEIAADIVEMTDGSFLIVGGKEDKKTGEYDIMLIKVDADGGEQWTRVLEDERNVYGRYIRKTSEGYVIIALESTNNNYNITNMFLERYTEDFELIRRTQLTSPDGYYRNNEPISSFLVLADGSFLIETSTYDRIQTQKISSDGIPQEPVDYINSDVGARFASTIAPTLSGGYVIATIPQYNSYELLLNYLDADGNPTGSPVNYSISETGQVTGVGTLPDSTLLVTFYGYYNSNSSYLVHIDQSGTVLAQTTLSNAGYYARVLSLPDSSFHLFGNAPEIYNNFGVSQSGTVILSFDDINATEQATSYGGTLGDGMKSVIRTSDGRFAIVGYTRSYGAGGSDASLIFYQP